MSTIDTGTSLLFAFGMFCFLTFGCIWLLSKYLVWARWQHVRRMHRHLGRRRR